MFKELIIKLARKYMSEEVKSSDMLSFNNVNLNINHYDKLMNDLKYKMSYSIKQLIITYNLNTKYDLRSCLEFIYFAVYGPVEHWCERNAKKRWMFMHDENNYLFLFEDKTDALNFKLTFDLYLKGLKKLED